jgi:hypothetical protein
MAAGTRTTAAKDLGGGGCRVPPIPQVLRRHATTGNESRDPAFFEKVRRVRPLFLDYFARNGIEDCGFIRDQAGAIELTRQSGARMTCRRPWDTLAIHANGDVHPCMSWTREPVGNLARQSFEDIWCGEELARLRACAACCSRPAAPASPRPGAPRTRAGRTSRQKPSDRSGSKFLPALSAFPRRRRG